ncbi:flagellar type III secretion system protein FlhA [Butyrivibrio sp. VCB2001]|uniref:flagellar type III secretion system protein FlhA n=1 Tax=Butyrivibrio sp. VCB2001 TaxID=1280667 RepID=UPI0004076E45|nr:flagellar type III secretion system protein FlhA [Butyrivibrio sp. VCB2001]
MARDDNVYMSALEGKSIPILTLDDKWHQLFTQTEMTPEIESLSEELNALVDRDGKIRTETKKIKKLKKTLLSEIVPLRDKANKSGGNNAAIEKEISERTRLINECNEKLDSHNDELLNLSRQIYDVDYKLMIETMKACYDTLHSNTEYIKGLDEWISKVRVELKKNVIHLQEAEMENYNLYSYMHQIFGPEVIDLFDMKYDPNRRHPIRRPLEGYEDEYVE